MADCLLWEDEQGGGVHIDTCIDSRDIGKARMMSSRFSLQCRRQQRGTLGRERMKGSAEGPVEFGDHRSVSILCKTENFFSGN